MRGWAATVDPPLSHMSTVETTTQAARHGAEEKNLPARRRPFARPTRKGRAQPPPRTRQEQKRQEPRPAPSGSATATRGRPSSPPPSTRHAAAASDGDARVDGGAAEGRPSPSPPADLKRAVRGLYATLRLVDEDLTARFESLKWARPRRASHSGEPIPAPHNSASGVSKKAGSILAAGARSLPGYTRWRLRLRQLRCFEPVRCGYWAQAPLAMARG